MTSRRQIIFLELSSNRTLVELPYKLYGVTQRASIVNWEFAPITYVNNLNGEPISPFYFQLRFSGGLESNFIPFGGAKDMVQIPLLRLGGWPTYFKIPIPLESGRKFESRFLVEVYGEGVCPTPAVFGPDTRLLLWVEVEVGEDRNSEFNADAYIN